MPSLFSVQRPENDRMTFGVVLAGLGRIGCGYDLRRPVADPPASHGRVDADPYFTALPLPIRIRNPAGMR